MSEPTSPPAEEEVELTLFGPGYGESIAVHLGYGDWAIVDSFLVPDETPVALRYLENIGVNPAEAVVLIVATHWHDDHIRGIAQLVELCPTAQFCCAGVFCYEEFLTVIGTLESNHFSSFGSSLRELYQVFSRLSERNQTPIFAHANLTLLSHQHCEIRSLSPSNRTFQKFLQSLGKLVPQKGERKIRLPTISPNEAAVVLWLELFGCSLLLGSDLEKGGWMAILKDPARGSRVASVFKVPHHGSENANLSMVWDQMLNKEPVAILTPWRRGSRKLPTKQGVQLILQSTPNVWITNNGLSRHTKFRHKDKAVERTLRETGISVRSLVRDSSFVRFRQLVDVEDQWTIESFGNACHLSKYTV